MDALCSSVSVPDTFIKILHSHFKGLPEKQRKILFTYFPSVLQLCEGLICKHFALQFHINKSHMG